VCALKSKKEGAQQTGRGKEGKAEKRRASIQDFLIAPVTQTERAADLNRHKLTQQVLRGRVKGGTESRPMQAHAGIGKGLGVKDQNGHMIHVAGERRVEIVTYLLCSSRGIDSEEESCGQIANSRRHRIRKNGNRVDAD